MNQTELIVDQYLRERKASISSFLKQHLGNEECMRIQKSHLLKDLIRNPINVFWAIPYFAIKKTLEVSEKMGFDRAKTFLSRIPRSLKTDYQKEIERLIMVELFELDQLEEKLDPVCAKDLKKTILQEIELEVGQYCTRQNELSDLLASGIIVLLSHLTFGDKSLDLFGLGSKIAGKWAYKKAASNFFLGESLGKSFYSYAPPEPTDKHVFLFTSLVLIVFAVMTTLIGVLSFPTQKRFGVTARQLAHLVDLIDDRLLLALAKSNKNKDQVAV